MTSCPVCGKHCMQQGLGVHMQRAHNPKNRYGSRRGMRYRYNENNKRILVAASDMPKIEPIKMLIENPNITNWELRAIRSRDRILARYTSEKRS